MGNILFINNERKVLVLVGAIVLAKDSA